MAAVYCAHPDGEQFVEWSDGDVVDPSEMAMAALGDDTEVAR